MEIIMGKSVLSLATTIVSLIVCSSSNAQVAIVDPVEIGNTNAVKLLAAELHSQIKRPEGGDRI